MHNSEWSLIIFTLLGQFSAGLTIGLVILDITGSLTRDSSISLILRKGVFIAAACMIIAMLASFFHLSAPMSSFYALSNLKDSWLSREILMVSLFTGLLLFSSARLLYFDREGKRLNLLLILSSAAGLLMVFSMAKIYMLPTVPAWNTPQTLIRFFTGGIITGTGFLLIMPGLSQIKPLSFNNSSILYIFSGIISAALVIRMAGSYLAGAPVQEENIAFVHQIALATLILPWILWFTGSILLIWLVLRPAANSTRSGNLKKLAFVLIILAAFIDRYFFYELYYSVGM